MKKIILSLLFIPSLTFACVVDKDGTYNCAGSESPYVQVKNEKEKVLFEKSKIVLTNILSEMKDACSTQYNDPNSCLCANPNIKNKLKFTYESIIYQMPEWDDKIIELNSKTINMSNIKSFSEYQRCTI